MPGDLQTKNWGFMLIESLVTVIILGLAVGTITQVLSVRFRRMNQSSDAITAQLVLAKEMNTLLASPKVDAKESQLPDFGNHLATLEITEAKITEESDLHSFRNLIKPIHATIKLKTGTKDQCFKLLGFKLLNPKTTKKQVN
jgi:type II secretory pathway pseudopilin PulG